MKKNKEQVIDRLDDLRKTMSPEDFLKNLPEIIYSFQRDAYIVGYKDGQSRRDDMMADLLEKLCDNIPPTEYPPNM